MHEPGLADGLDKLRAMLRGAPVPARIRQDETL
jgi:hypothetical protein